MTTDCPVPKIIIEDSDDDYAPLLSDAEKLNKLQKGELLKFNPDDSPANRTIDSKSFLTLIQENTGNILKPIRIENAIINIEKKLDLRYVNFKRELSITNSTFNGEIDLSFATFEGQVRFDGSTFEKKAQFIAAHAKYDFDIVGACFRRAANFEDLHVDELLNASGAHFADVNFQRIRVCKDAVFAPYEEKAAQPAGVPDDAEGAAEKPEGKIVKAYPVCFKGDANFTDAFVDSVADFKGARFNGKATFVRVRIDSAAFFSCYIREPKDGSEGEFLRTQFDGETNFIASRFGGNASFIGVVFNGEAEFERTRVGGHVLFRPARFGDEIHVVEFLKGVSFFNAHIQINAEFDGAIFKGKADFELFKVEGNLFLRSHYCNDKPPCTHEALPVRFEGKTVFMAANVNGRADFTGAQFINTNDDVGQLIVPDADDARREKDNWKKSNNFESFCVGGNAIFDPFHYPSKRGGVSIAVTFGGVANFNNACFKNGVNFPRACFQQTAHFVRTEVKGVASFEGAQFNKDTSFRGAHFDVVRFREEGSLTDKPLDKPAPATSLNVSTPTSSAAQDSVEIPAQITVPPTAATSSNGVGASPPKSGASASANVANVTLIPSPTDFTLFKTGFDKVALKVRKLKPKRRPSREYSCTDFGKDINLDLRGFTYERIELSLHNLLDKLEKNEQVPFDRQPYTQLEKAYLSVGDDYRAGDVYYALRRREHKQGWKKLWRDIQMGKLVNASFKFIAQLFDFIFLRGVTRYGVRPFRLLFISVGFILAGGLIFSQPGAVMLKEKAAATTEQAGAASTGATTSPNPATAQHAPAAPNPATADNKKPTDNPGCCNRTQAIGVSFNQFIPIVEIASGSQWKPSTKLLWGNYFSYAFYGSLHRLAGVILVPLGLAALTGLLHRRERNGK